MSARIPWPAAAGGVSGALAAEASLLATPEAGLRAALFLGIRVGAGAWVVCTLVGAGWSMMRGGPGAAESPRGIPAGVVLLGGAVVLAAILLRAPGRLAVTILGFGLTALPLVLVVQRRAGPGLARSAAAALTVFAVIAAVGDARQAPPIEAYRLDSAFRWAVGWPTEGWVLRHEIRLDRPLEAKPLSLMIPLARPYSGPSRVSASLNGQPIGEAQESNQWTLRVAVSGEVAGGQTRLLFELRARPPDPALRIMAHRWSGGATLGPAASSYFDAVRWLPGTFNDAMGRPQAGIYVLRLEPAES